MVGRERWRAALFLLACAALIAAALVFAADRQGAAPPRPEPRGRSPLQVMRPPPAARRLEALARRRTARLRPAARRFLAAFFRYEVGEGGPALVAALRASATPAFARRLLTAPPRAPADGFPPLARLGALRIAFVSAGADRALVDGSARRGARAEQFSFLFALRGSAWLASGPGQ